MKTTKELLTQLAFVIIAALCSLPTAQAQSQENLVDRVSKEVGVTLPDGYQGKVKEYVNSSKVLEGSGGEFTEQFIKGQMKENWGISKQNQLLFIWDAIYEQVTKKNFYDGEDGNKQRLDDFENAMDNIEACGKKYKQEFIASMQRRSEEANRRSAEADRRSAEADRRSAILIHCILVEMIGCYQLRNSAYENEIEKAKETAKKSIQMCNKFNIDYHALLPLEVQRFYDIKPTSQQNTLTCEKAIVQLLNITLDEIVKLYHLYQKAPNAERDKYDIKHVIESCQEYNVDYKSKLTPEIRRSFGVE